MSAAERIASIQAELMRAREDFRYWARQDVRLSLDERAEKRKAEERESFLTLQLRTRVQEVTRMTTGIFAGDGKTIIAVAKVLHFREPEREPAEAALVYLRAWLARQVST